MRQWRGGKASRGGATARDSVGGQRQHHSHAESSEGAGCESPQTPKALWGIGQ